MMTFANKKVALIVEDDPDLHLAMSIELRRMGFDVRSAYHYAAALEHLSNAKPYIICIDLELPTESGYEVCEYVRTTLRLTDVPILVTSDSGYPEEMAYAEKAGANAFLRKPFSMSDLCHNIEVLVQRGKRSEPNVRRLLRL